MVAARLPDEVRQILSQCVTVQHSDTDDGGMVRWDKFDADVLEQLDSFGLLEEKVAAAEEARAQEAEAATKKLEEEALDVIDHGVRFMLMNMTMLTLKSRVMQIAVESGKPEARSLDPTLQCCVKKIKFKLLRTEKSIQ